VDIQFLNPFWSFLSLYCCLGLASDLIPIAAIEVLLHTSLTVKDFTAMSRVKDYLSGALLFVKDVVMYIVA